ncbi:LacI family DNA-binding transcriptional regulator [Haloechinothrix sp. LS1_15]|uniref:LacI family DNA-binding transcriptional regulator n=1 Tax=Haloechinothrix sp. LS1_15 TaxID=2652248 RepID=UPI002946BAF7|nr:LacI family DNA-binding transcriptional regulator [Haloechinothrix sp. LS1_15]MDV6011683.1 substrate-binding domain-containing protein [Haloechinothrix sp. LS1_15]
MATARVTLAEVARTAGVSRTTASFVLSGRTDMRISTDAQHRVLDAAERLGYRPNITARSLRTQVTNTIGLVSDTIATTQYAGQVIRGAIEAAHAGGRLLFVAETAGNPDVESQLIDEMLDRQVDALVYAVMYTRQARLPPNLGSCPVVLLNCINDSFEGPVVLPDELEGGREAARALVEAGRTERVYAIGARHRTPDAPDGIYAGCLRMDGAEEVLAAAGAGITGYVECAWEPEYGYEAVANLLDSGQHPGSLICANDRVAFGAYQALQERGRRVPGDVAVVSFDDSALASWLRPPLSSVVLPHYELGKAAVNLLLDNDLAPRTHLIPMRLDRKESV